MSAQDRGLSADPREAPREGGSGKMFWELSPQDVIGKPAELQCAKIEREWKRRKHLMEKASRRPWTENDNSPGTIRLREHTERPFGADALFRHVNVQSKTVFSYAMTLMDKVQICHVHVDLNQESFDKEQMPNTAMVEYLKKRMSSIMLCTSWVCAGTFVDHERVSEKYNFTI